MSDRERPEGAPCSRLDRLPRHMVHGARYAAIRRHHRPEYINPDMLWRKGGHARRCPACDALWPCDVGMALETIEFLMQME